MNITIFHIPDDRRDDMLHIGGEIIADGFGLIDVTFSNHKMYVRDGYVKLRDDNHHTTIICDDEFSSISIR